MRTSNERGVAMVTVLLVLMLMSALLVGFTTMVMSDQRYRFIDRDRGQAFYAATAGIEKLTADLGNLFLVNVAPTATDVTALTATSKKPTIPNVTFEATLQPLALPASLLTTMYCNGAGTKTLPVVGSYGYTIRYCANSSGKPTTSDNPQVIKTGPYEGLTALQTPYQLDVTARTSTGGEVHLARTIEAVSIPVFQFGIFSDVDLSFYAADPFTFGGRIHTNGNLFLAEGSLSPGATLTTTGKVTAVKEVVRKYLSNGETIAAVGMAGTVTMALPGGGTRVLLDTEGSVTGNIGAGATLNPNWNTISTGSSTSPPNPPPGYNGYLRNGKTGAKTLSLPLVSPAVGGTNADLIQRPVAGEDPASIKFGERLFSKASLRILLSDLSVDITALPTVDNLRTPVQLAGDWRGAAPNNGVAYGPVDATHPPIARSLGPLPGVPVLTTAATAAGATTISAPVPGWFRKPGTLYAKNAAGTSIAGPITGCTWAATQFTNCTVGGTVSILNGWTVYIAATPGPPPGGAVTAPGSMPGSNVNPTVTLALGAAVAPGAGRTLTLTAGQTTFPFAANTFFIIDNTGKSVPVTCTDNNAIFTQFQGCTGVPATAAGTTITTSYLLAQNAATLDGWIKIDRQDADGTWHDVTMEILNFGIGAPNLNTGAALCADPTPNAIVRLQRLRDNGGAAGCTIGDTTNSYEWWPNVLFDTREGTFRDADPLDAGVGVRLGGVMYYVTLDVKNLAKWFKASAPYNTGTGAGVKLDNGGYTVYFSDRRNNRNAVNAETGEYGFEDQVNPGAAGGAPNSACDLPGEDVNGNGACETYGQNPSSNGVASASPYAAGAVLDVNARPWTRVKRGDAQVNRSILFRRALKLINGSALNNAPTAAADRIPGLTVVSENPVYIQGNWNAFDATSFGINAPHAATAVIADAVTLLSEGWNDNSSFIYPYDASQAAGNGRIRRGLAADPSNTYYRVAILAGKPPSFAKPADLGATPSVFGTDGGAHNFLRMLEGDTVINGFGTAASTTVNYRGSLATLFYSRQGLGTFKCCSGTAQDGIVYSVPIRNFFFDTDFTDPSKLPPNTPMFRDMNAVGFSQELRPGR
jgi:Tfp pilus assembly protein PilX